MFQRVSWATIGMSISRVRTELEPDPKARYKNLDNIGIDETSYSKGHQYLTTVVNLDTCEVVWAGVGHDYETLSRFFKELTPEQLAGIKRVAGDGARWIDKCVDEFIPHAKRCIDFFHVVQWAMEALDKVRAQSWHRDANELKALIKEMEDVKEEGSSDKKLKKKLQKAKDSSKQIKNSKYALGKNPENLSRYQEEKLEYISNTDKVLFQAYSLKELLRLALKVPEPEEAEAILRKFFWRATHSRIDEFKELGHKIKRHWDHIMNTLKHGLSNAPVEAMNNKIKFIFRKAYGFRNLNNMIDMVMLGCSNLKLYLSNRPFEDFYLA